MSTASSAQLISAFGTMLDGRSRVGVICNIGWLSSYIILEHYYLLTLLKEQYGFDIIDSATLNTDDPDALTALNSYDVLIVAYQGLTRPPLHLLSCYKIFKIDDLVSYNAEYDKLLDYLIKHSDMVISPYAYEFSKYFKHDNLVWVPYSSALEGSRYYEDLVFNDAPIKKVLVSGSVAWDRPFRSYVVNLKNENIEVLQHPGYGGRYDDNSEAPARGNFFREIAKFLCGFTDAHTYRYIHLKNFEIASVGSLLLTDRLVEKEMNELGFVDYETCIFCDQGTFLEKVSWILDEGNRPTVDKIRHAGMELVREKHMTRHRAAQLAKLVDDLCTSDASSAID